MEVIQKFLERPTLNHEVTSLRTKRAEPCKDLQGGWVCLIELSHLWQVTHYQKDQTTEDCLSQLLFLSFNISPEIHKLWLLMFVNLKHGTVN